MRRFSLIAVPKPFAGDVGVIQWNAIHSWKRLPALQEIILLGRETGVEEAARTVGAVHVPGLALDDEGIPRLDDVFRIGQEAATSEWVCYVNCDIILLPEFALAVDRVASVIGRSLVVSRRWNLDVKERIEFHQTWVQDLRARTRAHGTLFTPFGIDIFAFPKGFFKQIPAFSLGRFSWDNWLVHEARRIRAPVVDVTEACAVIHQNHRYEGYRSANEFRRSPKALRNFWLAGDTLHGLCSIDDATHVLRDEDVVPASTRSVSVVITHAGALPPLRELLRTFTYQSHPRTYTEVIVVEVAAEGQWGAIPLDFPFVVLTCETRPGTAAARNKGAAIAHGELVVFLDSGCHVRGDWVEKLHAACGRHGFEPVVASDVQHGFQKKRRSAVEVYDALNEAGTRSHDITWRSTGVAGTMIPRSVLRRVGPFREEPADDTGAESEWMTRASALGIGLVFAAGVTVTVPASRNWRQLADKAQLLTRTQIRSAGPQAAKPTFGAWVGVHTKQLLSDVRTALASRSVPFHIRLSVCFVAMRVWSVRLRATRQEIDRADGGTARRNAT